MTLYKNDLILYIGRDKKEHIGYISEFNIANANFQVNNPLINDKGYNVGSTTWKSIERLDIDILGNVYRNGKNFTKEAAAIIQNELN